MAGVEIRTVRRARGGLAGLRERMREAQGSRILVGSVGPEARRPFFSVYEGRDLDLTVAGMLAIHEFGVGVPVRPILHNTLDDRRGEIARAILQGVAWWVANGSSVSDVRRGLAETGEDCANITRAHLQAFPANRLQPLSEKYVRERRFNKNPRPLIDTGQILDSISFRVEL